MDGYYGSRGVEEHFWMNSMSGGRPSAVTYRGYNSYDLDGEHYFQSILAMCFVYFLARVFFDGVVGLLLVGLVGFLLVMLFDTASTLFRPHRDDHFRRRMF